MAVFNENIKEKDFQTKVSSFLKSHNITMTKIHSGAIYLPTNRAMIRMTSEPFVYTGNFRLRTLTSGFSDLMLFADGKVQFVELKKNTTYLRIDQKEKFNELYEKGFIKNCWVLKPKNWTNFKKYYKEYQNLGRALELSMGINTWKTYIRDDYENLNDNEKEFCSHIRHIDKKQEKATKTLIQRKDESSFKFLCEFCYSKLK